MQKKVYRTYQSELHEREPANQAAQQYFPQHPSLAPRSKSRRRCRARRKGDRQQEAASLDQTASHPSKRIASTASFPRSIQQTGQYSTVVAAHCEHPNPAKTPADAICNSKRRPSVSARREIKSTPSLIGGHRAVYVLTPLCSFSFSFSTLGLSTVSTREIEKAISRQTRPDQTHNKHVVTMR